MKKPLFFLVLSGLVFSLGLSAPAAEPQPWRAEWITPASEIGPNSWLCFRRTFDLSAVPQKAEARIACDSKYWLWVNGRMVVFEGQLKRGPTPADTYFDRVDLAPYLQKGENTVAVLVWYWGKDGFSHNNSGKAGMIFDAQIGDQTLLSGADWKAILHPAYGSTETPHPNFRLPEHNILFDATKDIGDWTAGPFDDSAWPAAVALGKVPVAPWNNLYERPTPQWKNSGLRDYVNAAELPAEGNGDWIIAKLPYNCHVTPYLKIDAPEAGMRIDIQTDDYMGGGPPNLRAVYITKTGVQEYESLGWINGHEMWYKIPAGVKILALKYRETGYNAESVGRFTCDDEALNTLWEKARRTLYVTMRDTYMDCPDRERAQWWGDAVNELGEAFYVFDSQNGPLLAKKGIFELARWQRPDKTLYSPVPAALPHDDSRSPNDGTWSKELPPQMLASVGHFGFWTYYLYTGDRDTIAAVYPAVRDYLSVWQLGPDGLVIHRRGDWDWSDWGEDIDVAVLDNAWLYSTLGAACEMARLTGHDDDIPAYRAKMDSIREHFNATFWQGDKYRSPGYKGKTDDRANAMAVVVGLAEPEQYPAIRKVLAEEYHASPYMEKYVLEALYKMDAPEQAIERMKNRWAEQIESPLTTLWEGWGIGEKGFGGGTYNHAWSGGALTMLSQYTSGIAPTSPGWKTFGVYPQPEPLRSIETVVPTPQGDIVLRLKRDETVWTIRLTVPEGTTATLGVPRLAGPVQSIRCNDRNLWDGCTLVESAKEGPIQPAGEDARWFRLTVPPGTWLFETKW